MKDYRPIKYYKKFKRQYLQFVVFIKYGNYYYTFDSDAKIMLNLIGGHLKGDHFIISKRDFSRILKILHENGLNVVLAGYKNVEEFYTIKQSNYMKVRAKSKEYYRATNSSKK